MTISVVIPTFNRADVVAAKARRLCQSPDVDELIVVADGCSDHTVAALRQIDSEKLKVIARDGNEGTPTARNHGIDAATGDWIGFCDDDDDELESYFATLRAVAIRHQADIVGAPQLRVPRGTTLEEHVAELRRQVAEGEPSDGRLGFSGAEFTETPFVSPNVICRRAVFDSVRFDPRYRGNFWCEETDFAVSAARAGFKVGTTDTTFTFSTVRHGGGAHSRSRLAYEYWTLRNYWQYLTKHESWLRERGLITSRLGGEAAFARDRAAIYEGKVRRRASALAARLRRVVPGA